MKIVLIVVIVVLVLMTIFDIFLAFSLARMGSSISRKEEQEEIKRFFESKNNKEDIT